jgi:hypothetical protein
MFSVEQIVRCVDKLQAKFLAYQAETDATINKLSKAFETYKAESEVCGPCLGCIGSHIAGHHCAADGPDRDADAGVYMRMSDSPR